MTGWLTRLRYHWQVWRWRKGPHHVDHLRLFAQTYGVPRGRTMPLQARTVKGRVVPMTRETGGQTCR